MEKQSHVLCSSTIIDLDLFIYLFRFGFVVLVAMFHFVARFRARVVLQPRRNAEDLTRAHVEQNK